jgi:hypothetical protein
MASRRGFYAILKPVHPPSLKIELRLNFAGDLVANVLDGGLAGEVRYLAARFTQPGGQHGQAAGAVASSPL